MPFFQVLSISHQTFKLADLRSNGNIYPFPAMTVQKKSLNGCEMAVVVVEPSNDLPIRFRGRTWVRVGPRRAIATPEEERRLVEKRESRDVPFDIQPVWSATLDDLDLEYFKRVYLPSALAEDIIAENQRSTSQQLSSLRFATIEPDAKPTMLGLLIAGKDPGRFFPGAYIQFLRIDGNELTDVIKDRQEIGGTISQVVRKLNEKLQAHISIATEITSDIAETRQPDYPIRALQQLAYNAILHRRYEGTNAPARFYWYADRIEMLSPGGPYGELNRQNFGIPGITDYRNPHLAEAMRTLGLIQRFGVGILIARQELERNGNPPLEFVINKTYVNAIVRRRT
jgi:ATP-dependent DNA helicase RecG